MTDDIEARAKAAVERFVNEATTYAPRSLDDRKHYKVLSDILNSPTYKGRLTEIIIEEFRK
jgi:hypothetical protein